MRRYFFLFSFLLWFTFPASRAEAAVPDSVCYVYYLDVGQGAASLLAFPCGAILIDAGGQSDEHIDAMIGELEAFFDDRPELDRSFASVMITHDHPDHTKGLDEVLEHFTVERLIYNGKAEGSRSELLEAVEQAGSLGVEVVEVSFEMVTEGGNLLGYTDENIDPLDCQGIDPEIRILSGGFESNPGWPHREFDNDNNHSLVFRVDYGASSFFFSGDLEEDAIETLVEYYGGTNMLDADVYQVGHHGSYNATTDDWLELISPEIAVIPVGQWDYGKGTNNRFSTYWYGHPRRTTIKLLEDYLPGGSKKRSESIKPKLASGSTKFRVKRIKKKIYATAWDECVRIRATWDGKFRVDRHVKM